MVARDFSPWRSHQGPLRTRRTSITQSFPPNIVSRTSLRPLNRASTHSETVSSATSAAHYSLSVACPIMSA
jgi:hypothetical protein